MRKKNLNPGIEVYLKISYKGSAVRNVLRLISQYLNSLDLNFFARRAI